MDRRRYARRRDENSSGIRCGWQIPLQSNVALKLPTVVRMMIPVGQWFGIRGWGALLVLVVLAGSGYGQELSGALGTPEAPQPSVPGVTTERETETQAPDRVDVRPVARDQEIASRLQRILEATDWIENPGVRVEEGVVFITGQTETEQVKRWARDLARNTQDVVAVVNRIKLVQPPVWDLGPAREQLGALWRGFVRAFPLTLFALLILAVAWMAGVATARIAKRFLHHKVSTALLREVLSRAAGVVIFLLGLYFVLLVAGLARLAVTVLGGTGLIGLIIGIAFRDITENFLASIFLSMQNPFRSGDLVEIEGVLGLVQRLTIRSTVLMTLDGNHVQIPNATVYKSKIRNYTSNPNRREEFMVGIGFDDVITEAQEIALEVLAGHPAILKNPEPWVLVDSLGASTVKIKVYFWIDGTVHGWLKVRSSVIRLVKRAYQEHGISMPDDAREVVFPKEIPVRLLGDRALMESGESARSGRPPRSPAPVESDTVSTASEGGLRSDTAEVQEQGRRSRNPEEGEDLLHSGAPAKD